MTSAGFSAQMIASDLRRSPSMAVDGVAEYLAELGYWRVEPPKYADLIEELQEKLIAAVDYAETFRGLDLVETERAVRFANMLSGTIQALAVQPRKVT